MTGEPVSLLKCLRVHRMRHHPLRIWYQQYTITHLLCEHFLLKTTLFLPSVRLGNSWLLALLPYLSESICGQVVLGSGLLSLGCPEVLRSTPAQGSGPWTLGEKGAVGLIVARRICAAVISGALTKSESQSGH